jgi:hypothetical protein
MTSTALHYAVIVGLAGLALIGAISSLAQIRTGAGAASHLSQYCAPEEASSDVHRFYCRDDGRG